MNSPSRQNRARRGTTAAPTAEEELETGEPLAEELPPDQPSDPNKIPAKGGKFHAKPWDNSNKGGSGGSGGSGDGQVELATAKYLKKRPEDSGDRQSRSRSSSHSESTSGRSLEGNVFNSGVIGGMLAMIGAVVWFSIGLMNDVIFFYPPILFVIGLGALFKGLAGGSDS